ncbi:protein tyrosine phosphatase type IVA 2 isoform X1 [Coturnix japonica]|uniref:protein tyrosine phosphatase type IVA 2 isoform X1 n=1 Tax=Coturnix japonica TaxID=93934 RepID=UPI0007777A03|nr:protein tyrosine phosphatase type IVA 2 isoform X1 [Coturnix japonica]
MPAAWGGCGELRLRRDESGGSSRLGDGAQPASRVAENGCEAAPLARHRQTRDPPARAPSGRFHAGGLRRSGPYHCRLRGCVAPCQSAPCGPYHGAGRGGSGLCSVSRVAAGLCAVSAARAAPGVVQPQPRHGPRRSPTPPPPLPAPIAPPGPRCGRRRVRSEERRRAQCPGCSGGIHVAHLWRF